MIPLGRTLPALVLCASAFLGSAPVARADVPPPDVSGCNNKEAGDDCKTDEGASGTCEQSTCSRLDYSTDPPSSQQYDCLKCTIDDGGCAMRSGPAALGALGGGAVAAALLLWQRRRARPRRASREG